LFLLNELSTCFCVQFLRLLSLKQIGRHYFNPAKHNDIPQHSLQLWPGFITAIAEYDGGAMLNIDLAHKILRTGMKKKKKVCTSK